MEDGHAAKNDLAGRSHVSPLYSVGAGVISTHPRLARRLANSSSKSDMLSLFEVFAEEQDEGEGEAIGMTECARGSRRAYL